MVSQVYIKKFSSHQWNNRTQHTSLVYWTCQNFCKQTTENNNKNNTTKALLVPKDDRWAENGFYYSALQSVPKGKKHVTCSNRPTQRLRWTDRWTDRQMPRKESLCHPAYTDITKTTGFTKVRTYLSRVNLNRHSCMESSDVTNRGFNGRRRKIFSKNTWNMVIKIK